MSHRSTDPGVINAKDASSSGRDFDLGIPGFRYSDLHDARRLADLARRFDVFLTSADPDLFALFDAYRRKPATLRLVVLSHLVADVPHHCSRVFAFLINHDSFFARR